MNLKNVQLLLMKKSFLQNFGEHLKEEKQAQPIPVLKIFIHTRCTYNTKPIKRDHKFLY